MSNVGSPIDGGKKKADVAELPEGIGDVGILFNGPPGTTELPFNESSEIEFSDPTEPMPGEDVPHIVEVAGRFQELVMISTGLSI